MSRDWTKERHSSSSLSSAPREMTGEEFKGYVVVASSAEQHSSNDKVREIDPIGGDLSIKLDLLRKTGICNFPASSSNGGSRTEIGLGCSWFSP